MLLGNIRGGCVVFNDDELVGVGPGPGSRCTASHRASSQTNLSDLNVAGSCQPRQLDGQGNGDFGDQLAIWNSQAISLRDSRGACNIGGVIWPRELGTA